MSDMDTIRKRKQATKNRRVITGARDWPVVPGSYKTTTVLLMVRLKWKRSIAIWEMDQNGHAYNFQCSRLAYHPLYYTTKVCPR